MKKLISILLLFSIAMYCNGQDKVAYRFDKYNSKSITAIVNFQAIGMGFFKKETNKTYSELYIKRIKRYYAYDKKNQGLYVETAEGNFLIELNSKYAKYYKQNVTNLKGQELDDAVAAVSKSIVDYYEAKNIEAQKALDDERERVKKEKLRIEREDSIKKVRDLEAREVYKKKHKYTDIPVKKGTLYCDFCKKSVEIDDTITCYAANDNKMVWFDMLQGELGLDYFHAHQGDISSTLKGYEPFKYHYEVFKDSLNAHYNAQLSEELDLLNTRYFLEHMVEIQKKAPHGYFESWSWDKDYSFITFSCTYVNTNKKTIKYIEVFWKALNDVGDVRKTGSFKGTGPVESWQSGSWSWDYSHYYVAGDTSKMRLTKVIITYMDGSKVVIPQAKIVEN